MSNSISQISIPPLPSQEALLLECYRSFGEPVQTKEYKTSEKVNELWDKAINKKDPRSMVVLGALYTLGCKGILEKDYSRAFHWFAEAAKLGEAEAMIYVLWMAVSAQEDESKKVEFKKTLEKIKEDAAKKIPAAEAALGLLYLHSPKLFLGPSGGFVDQSPRLVSSLSSLLQEDDSVGSDVKSTIEELWTDAARNGCVFVMPLLANLLFLKNEEVEAKSWCDRAIEGGNPHGYYTLALYCKSKGNDAEYLAYLKKGAAAGDPIAIKTLAYEVSHGGGPFDIDQFIQLSKECAELGDGSSMEDLARCYLLKNQGKLAVSWFKRASVNTHWFGKVDQSINASHVFRLYVEGRGDLLPNPQKAVKWLRDSAERGLGQSMWDLFKLGSWGIGNGGWDPRESRRWELRVNSLPPDELEHVYKSPRVP